MGQFAAHDGAELASELFTGDEPAFQPAIQAFLLCRVHEFAGIVHAQIFKTADGLLIPQAEHHTAHIKYQVLYHYSINFL